MTTFWTNPYRSCAYESMFFPPTVTHVLTDTLVPQPGRLYYYIYFNMTFFLSETDALLFLSRLPIELFVRTISTTIM